MGRILNALTCAQVPLHKFIIPTDTPGLLCGLPSRELEILDTLIVCAGQSSDDLVLGRGEHADFRSASTERDNDITLLQTIDGPVDIRSTLALFLGLVAAFPLASVISPI